MPRGGGSDPAPSGEAPPSPDETAPAVSTTSPKDGDTRVVRTEAITANFNEDIFAETVDGTSFSLVDSDSGVAAGTVSFDANSNVASFAPNAPLAMLESYTAILTTQITDLSGNAMAADYTWTFTAADGAWKTPEQIGVGAYDVRVRDPQIALDADGGGLAV